MENSAVFSCVSEHCTINTLVALRCTSRTICSYYDSELVFYLQTKYELTVSASFSELVDKYDENVLDVVRSPSLMHRRTLIVKCVDEDNVELINEAPKYNLLPLWARVIIFNYAICKKSYKIALELAENILVQLSDSLYPLHDEMCGKTTDTFLMHIFRSCNVDIITKLSPVCRRLAGIINRYIPNTILLKYISHLYVHYYITGDSRPLEACSSFISDEPANEMILHHACSVDFAKHLKDNKIVCNFNLWHIGSIPDNFSVKYFKGIITYGEAKQQENEYSLRMTERAREYILLTI